MFRLTPVGNHEGETYCRRFLWRSAGTGFFDCFLNLRYQFVFLKPVMMVHRKKQEATATGLNLIKQGELIFIHVQPYGLL
jgi:hypothetical protein